MRIKGVGFVRPAGVLTLMILLPLAAQVTPIVNTVQTPGQPQPQPAVPAQQAPQQAPPAGAAPQTSAAAVEAGAPLMGSLTLQNANLSEVVDQLARTLKLNYIMDPRVPRAGVTLNTYGEAKDIDARALLDTILRINGAAMVQAGNIWRIVPLADLKNMPLKPEQNVSEIPEDDRPMLNLVFLKYANVDELSKLLADFLGPDGRAWAYPPANLLLVLDSRRNMKRTMEMIALFDSDVLAKQRVRLFDTKYSRPSDLATELEQLLKSMSLSKEVNSLKFVPVDRINTLIAVAPNPGVFAQVEEWINKLDVKVDAPSGKIDTYVYRVRYGRAEFLASSFMMLFGGGGFGYGMGGFGMGGYGMGGYGMGMPQGGMGLGVGGLGTSAVGGYNPGAYMQGNPGLAAGVAQSAVAGGNRGGAGAGGGAASGVGGMGVGAMGMGGMGMGGLGSNLTGSFLGGAGYGMMGMGMTSPRVVPNLFDNSLMILGTREEYESVIKLLRELDVPPRQVLIEARIFEVSLTGAFAWGVTSALRSRSTPSESTSPGNPSFPPTARAMNTLISNAGMSMSIGALVGQSKELLSLITAEENNTRTKVVSAPIIIATDSVPASINVGIEVPTLTAQAVSGAQQGGSSLFANTISNRRTGVTLSITARVNPSGVVTLQIEQEVSAPQAPAAGAAIQSPSFSQRTVSTQVTVNDGDMIAIGGIMNENNSGSSAGVPFLNRIPVLGAAFGAKSTNSSRTELVVFITPRVIYDTNQMTDASDELVTRMKRLQKLIRD